MISKIFANSRPSASNFKSFSRSVELFFLTLSQNNFDNKIPFCLGLTQDSINESSESVDFIKKWSWLLFGAAVQSESVHILFFKVKIEGKKTYLNIPLCA